MALTKSSLVDLNGINGVYKILADQQSALIEVVGSALGLLNNSLLDISPNKDLHITRKMIVDDATVDTLKATGLTVTGDVELDTNGVPTNLKIYSTTMITGDVKVDGSITASGLNVSPKDPLKVNTATITADDSNVLYLLGTKNTSKSEITNTVNIENGPSIYMDSSGTLTATDITIVSSKEAKENIKASELNALDLINKIDIVDYIYKMDPKAIPHIGFIAENTDPLLSTPKKNRMDYTNCIGVLLKAVQELSKKVAVLEARV